MVWVQIRLVIGRLLFREMKVIMSKSTKKLSSVKPRAAKKAAQVKAVKKSSNSSKKKLDIDNIIIGVGIVLVILGFFMLIKQAYSNRIKPTSSNTSIVAVNPENNQVPLIEGKPIAISLPSVNINLDVADGNYNPNNNSWTLSSDRAHYGVMTAKANNKAGNTFIYGHNRKSVFGRLPKIKVGEQAIVTTEIGKVFTYKLREIITTKPTDTSLFSYKGAPILTLQTCTGAWYQDRSLFIFDFVSVE